MNAYQVLGWIGLVLVLANYIAISFSLMAVGTAYHVVNIIGGAGLAAVCYHQKTWQPLVLNIVWTAVAILALLV